MARNYGGISVKIDGDYNNKDIKRAIADLKALDTDAKNTQGAFGGMSNGIKAVGAAIAATFTVSTVVDFLRNSAQAAMEDERSMVALAKAMENVGLSAQNANVESFISKLSLARGVADDELRPALQRIVTVTKDVEEAQKALSLALDVSAGTGRDLDSVSQALARAYSGQTTALQRLGVGIDAATLKSKDMDLISQALSSRFQGQSAAAAETYEGRLRRVSIAAGEAQETIGYALLNALDDVSRTMGGTDGAVTLITQLGNGIAGLITQLGSAVSALTQYTGAREKANEEDEYSQLGYRRIVGLIPVVGAYLTVLSTRSEEVARAQGKARRAADAYTERLNAQARAAFAAANAQESMLEALGAGIYVNPADAGFDVAAFYGVNPSAQRAMAEARAGVESIVSDYQELQREQTNVGSSAGRTAEVLKVRWAEIAQSVDGAVVRITGRATEVSGKLATTFRERTDQFRSVINEQVSIIQSAQQSLDEYAGKVTDAIMGKIDFTTTDAEGKPLAPEQIMDLILGDIANRTKAVTEIAQSNIMTQLPMALAEKIMTLEPDAAVALANYLSANPAQLAQLTNNYNALATYTETALGVPMANTFAKVGDQSAVSMIVNARGKIAEQAEAFRRFVQNRLSTEITVGVRYVAVNSIPGVSGGEITVKARANGGPLFAGLPTLVGERGPELIVPQVAGTVVRGEKTRQMLRQGGGDVYLTVNAGMGTNGAEVGRQIVDALKAYERRNGPVYASA